jgi:hypothetical protein
MTMQLTMRVDFDCPVACDVDEGVKLPNSSLPLIETDYYNLRGKQ